MRRTGRRGETLKNKVKEGKARSEESRKPGRDSHEGARRLEINGKNQRENDT